MIDVLNIRRACAAAGTMIVAGLATAFGPRARDESAATDTDYAAIAKSRRVDKAALAAMHLQARFPVLALQYIASLNAGTQIDPPVRDELAALSHLADTFGFTFSAGTVLLIGREANGGVIGPAA